MGGQEVQKLLCMLFEDGHVCIICVDERVRLPSDFLQERAIQS